ncbi:lysylphosphatidylglycerol synthase transmembrane domain-containing protein [Tenacibaculum pacificus]|uniref:lysylphosphatidylglycerol synthase transmembrane domain-containing protein n=1 Tax=Tenacibaculum pacificus TaxID=3018314 RepID=UPI0022F3B047|nr:lysylphosphatidylglycerol synthase transmembrane domain-containing protein [Tenacibaculum pacificus]WBX74118.1 lysylphosphatidylglycerol synthase transmembrane domain-containing protein [Tenacibaculum pacificus]
MNKKLIKTVAKISISFLLLYFVFKKIDFTQVLDLYKKSNTFYLLVAIILFISSQFISSIRLNYIFHKNDFLLDKFSNLKLYFVGMFYNFFIPGGVGGDAYKVFILNKQFGWKAKQLTKCVFIDRLIGLLAIFSLLITMASYLFFSNPLFLILGIITSVISFFVGKFLLNRIFKKTNNYYTYSFFYSIIIQLLQIGTIICILKAFRLDIVNALSYCFTFLVSSVLSVVSFAGFGAREYVFLKASSFLNTDEAIAISVGLSFNIITAIISLVGVFFILNKLSLKTISIK